MTIIIGAVLVLLAIEGVTIYLWARLLRIRTATFARAFAALAMVYGLGIVSALLAALVNLNIPALIVLVVAQLGLGAWVFSFALKAPYFRAGACFLLYAATGVALAFLMRYAAVEAFSVPTASMSPVVLAGDRVLADKITLRFRVPRRGEVVVYRESIPPGLNYIKRVAAVEGDRVEQIGGDIYVNGCLIEGHRMPPYMPQEKQVMKYPATVPPGKLFVMGDNGEQSLDSRFWGFVDVKEVVGLVDIVYASAVPRERMMRPRTPPQGESPGRVRWERIGKLIK